MHTSLAVAAANGSVPRITLWRFIKLRDAADAQDSRCSGSEQEAKFGNMPTHAEAASIRDHTESVAEADKEKRAAGPVNWNESTVCGNHEGSTMIMGVLACMRHPQMGKIFAWDSRTWPQMVVAAASRIIPTTLTKAVFV
ncbi:hypothetical protein S7711_10658 [Stachybotrys chartarum IBT 7711]|uniref:Uncharacterized protein n=1 Tax=Stachybotrys chartarum (strain CBS 109288 / IBT 7711) TaxID=1280523 RepID=A0A084APA7_STACB|nr:hypothetical protein S7711_10658 [Stachybotrys chartarum IBT 7711]KFA47022.1 hypothetical protein S40293_11444 [Stachybotrys chartarum IBT 40293]KFA75015.1 hypothetical protein S40288_10694 [Stachybotrys chartarum IBT 40288]